MKFNYDLKTLQGDMLGGVTTAIIAVPLCLAFGVASGVGPVAGLYSAAAIGLFAAIFGGTSALISGPTAPMTAAMVVVLTHTANSLPEAFATVILAGLIQVALGASRIGRYFSYTPYMVVAGFMTGIGVIIISINIPIIFGQTSAAQSLSNLITIFPQILSETQFNALVIAAFAFVAHFAWPRRFRRYLPPALVALVVAMIATSTILPDTPLIGEIQTGIPNLQVPVVSIGFVLNVIEPAFVLAIIGSVNTLLISLVADSFTQKIHKPNKELVAQGLSNIVAGLIGALPGSGSTVTTSVNVRCGGTTRISSIIQALVLFSVIIGTGPFIEKIPLPAIAVILLVVGWNIIDWRVVNRLHKLDRNHVTVFLLTSGLTVFVDLITGVAIGLIIAAMINSRQFETVELDQVVSVPLIDADGDDPYSARTGLVKLSGHFTAASATALSRVITADIQDHDVVIFDFSGTTHIDDSAVIMIQDLVKKSYESNTPCVVIGLTSRVANIFNSFDALKLIDKQNFTDSLEEAREIANQILRK